MTPLFLYYLKASVALTLFYAFYKLLFDRDTFFEWKRAVMIGCIMLSAIYPFIDLSKVLQLNEPIKEAIILYAKSLPEISFNAESHPWWDVYDLSSALWLVYLLGVILLSIRMIIHLISILILVNRGQKTQLNGSEIIQLKGESAPFSFFHWIFINPEKHNENDLNEILTHEQTHAKEWHSIDVLFCEVASIAFWFNPFIWLFKLTIRQNLEFLADKRVIASGHDSRNYQYHLLRLTHQSAAATLVNNFNVSQLKKRIIMMNKQKSATVYLTKYALIIPLTLVLVVTNSTEALAKKVESLATESSLTAKPKPETPSIPTPPTPPAPKLNHDIFMVVEQMPEYPGGTNAMMSYIAQNVRYPVDAQEKKISGRVIIRFVVNKEGVVENPTIIKSVYPSLDNEAIRVVLGMAKWKPGMQAGKNVDVYFTLPISFNLTDDKTGDGIQVRGYGNETKTVEPPKLNENAIFFIDGVETTREEITKIDPKTIEKMEVLKEQAAIKIYGEKGKNGVILITKKK